MSRRWFFSLASFSLSAFSLASLALLIFSSASLRFWFSFTACCSGDKQRRTSDNVGIAKYAGVLGVDKFELKKYRRNLKKYIYVINVCV